MSNLILRTAISPYGDTTKGSVLSQIELDNNFISLKGEDIISGQTVGSSVVLKKINGEEITFNIGGGGSETSYWVSGSTGLFSVKANNDTTLDALGNYAVAEGNSTIASGASSHAEGRLTTAGGISSHAEGWTTIAVGNHSHAEGRLTNAIGDGSHAEGQGSKAIGGISHAEGFYTSSIGSASHTEGSNTTAVGVNSHSGGFNSISLGHTSFVHGSGSTANGEGTIVLGSNIVGSSPHTVYVNPIVFKAIDKNNITPEVGMVIFDTSTNKFTGWDGTAWQPFH